MRKRVRIALTNFLAKIFHFAIYFSTEMVYHALMNWMEWIHSVSRLGGRNEQELFQQAHNKGKT